jgi:hypothetical protein
MQFSRFCSECKNTVIKAYKLLVCELDVNKEKGYCASIYDGIQYCADHIHIKCDKAYVSQLIKKAESEIQGRYVNPCPKSFKVENLANFQLDFKSPREARKNNRHCARRGVGLHRFVSVRDIPSDLSAHEVGRTDVAAAFSHWCLYVAQVL